MKKVSIILALLFITAAFYFYPSARIDKSGKEYAMRHPRILKAWLAEQKEEKKKRPGYDRPDLAMEEEISLRSETGKPFSYSGSWKFAAMRRARLYNSLNKTDAGLEWVERGPANVGGRSRAIVVHPQDQNQWWVGAVGGGIWKTNDMGESWTCQSDNMPVISVTTIDICDSLPQILYAGTGEGFYNIDAIIGDGIFKTTDGGQTWTQLSSTISDVRFRYVNRIVVHPQHADTLLAATNYGLYRSYDGGESWQEVFANGSRVQQIIANPLNFNSLFIAVNGRGIYKSSDLFESWQYVSNDITDHKRIELAISEADTHFVYASAVKSDGNVRGFYQSTDGGLGWTFLGNSTDWFRTQGWYDNTVVVHPFDPNTVFLGGIDLYKIVVANQAATVNAISNWYGGNGLPYVHADQHFLVTLPRADSSFAIIAANDGGIHYSLDGGVTWNAKNTGYNVTQFYDVDRSPFADQFIGGTQDNGTQRSRVNAASDSKWEEKIGGDGFDCAWDKSDPNVVYGTLYSSLVRRSRSGGEAFAEATNGLPESDIFHTPLEMDPHNNSKLFTLSKENDEYKVFVTTDQADSWHSVNVDLGGSEWYAKYVKIAVSKKDSNIVWAASTYSHINVSTDGGQNFSIVNKPDGSPKARLTGLATSPRDSAMAFALFGVSGYGKIFRTSDLGQSWQDITADLPDIPVHCLLVMPYDSSEIWIGTDIGLFISYDEGQSWQINNGSIPAVSIRRLKIVDKEIVAATHGRGIWSVHNELLNQQEIPMREPVLNALNPPNPNTQFMNIHFMPRGLYDSLQVKVNDEAIATLTEFPAYKDTFVAYQATPPDYLDIVVQAFSDTLVLYSEHRGIFIFESVDSLNENFSAGIGDFSGDFVVTQEEGFNSNTMHTEHNYQNQRNYIALLNTPLAIRDSLRLTYKDVALVEPGETGYEYPAAQIWDYVTVEGSADGENWDILIKPYDCNFDDDWRFYYDGAVPGDESMFLDHEIKLDSLYAPGQFAYIRFRLYADEYSTGWGWAIDNVRIGLPSLTAVSSNDLVVHRFELKNNYPNPFNPSTTIAFSVDKNGPASLLVYNYLGQVVQTIFKDKDLKAGTLHKVVWDGHNHSGRQVASGVYFYKLTAGRKQTVKKMILAR